MILRDFHTRRTIAIISLAMCAHVPLQAALSGTEAAVSFPEAGTTGLGNTNFTVGWTFTVDVSRTATHLGIYANSDGSNFLFPREIGLWNASGSLIAQSTVPVGGGGAELDPASVSGNYGFFYNQLFTSVELAAGELYTVAIPYADDSSPGTFYGATITPMAGLNYGTSVFAGGATGLVQPTTIDTTFPNGWFGSNLRFAVVPEPASLPLLILGVGAIALFRTRKQ